MRASLQIVYEGDIGRPLTAAKVEDHSLLLAAAKVAIEEAYERAEAVASVDAFVGEVHREEARRLEKVLGMLVPELRLTPDLRLVPIGDPISARRVLRRVVKAVSNPRHVPTSLRLYPTGGA